MGIFGKSPGAEIFPETLTPTQEVPTLLGLVIYRDLNDVLCMVHIFPVPLQGVGIFSTHSLGNFRPLGMGIFQTKLMRFLVIFSINVCKRNQFSVFYLLYKS